MDNVAQFWSNAMAGASSIMSDFLGKVSAWQLLLAAVLLLVLVIILICALSSRNRKFDNLLDEQEKSKRETERAQSDLRKTMTDKEAEARRQAQDKAAEMDKEREQAGAALSRSEGEAASLRQSVDELTRFRDEYAQIPDARVEAGRIIREAKDHAYVVSNRTEMEYAEIIEHANQEAESIRALAQQRLQRSHEALKAALARSAEIIEEAHGEAMRIGKIAYMPGPGLIEAPAEQAPEQQNDQQTEANEETEVE